MNIPLPSPFLSRMEELLGNEYLDFIKIYDQPAVRGLRVNTLKIPIEQFQVISPFSLTPIPWSKEGFYYKEDERPGKHPYHEAGLYYMQEPSAMAVVSLLDPKPGEWVLDLAAAPGGKATQAAIRMKNEGLLVANEIHPTRAKILLENMERLGIVNAIVTNHAPAELAERWPELFDKVILDAPCSGEGMFRKDEGSRKEWSVDAIFLCAARQKELLEAASRLVKPGGLLIYSTCTFNRMENEDVIETFLAKHPAWRLHPLPIIEGFRPAIPKKEEGDSPASIEAKQPVQEGIVRLWPHHLVGEGHFIALLEKGEEECRPIKPVGKNKRRSRIPSELSTLFSAFERETIDGTKAPFLEGTFHAFGDYLSLLPTASLSLEGIRTLRAGLLLGQGKKNRFEPAHALSMALPGEAFKQRLLFSPDDPDLMRYLRGEVLTPPATGKDGWVSIQVDGYPLGWGKKTGGTIKNHYPKGLRRLT